MPSSNGGRGGHKNNKKENNNGKDTAMIENVSCENFAVISFHDFPVHLSYAFLNRDFQEYRSVWEMCLQRYPLAFLVQSLLLRIPTTIERTLIPLFQMIALLQYQLITIVLIQSFSTSLKNISLFFCFFIPISWHRFCGIPTDLACAWIENQMFRRLYI